MSRYSTPVRPLAGTLLALVLGLVATGPALASAPADLSTPLAPLTGTGGSDVIPGHYVVVLKTPATGTGAARAALTGAVDRAEDAGADVTHQYGAALNGYAADLSGAELAAVRTDPAVAYVEADRTISVAGSRTAYSWGQDRVDQRKGTNNKIATSGDGSGVTAYVIDTGVRATHDGFGSRVSSGYTAVNDGNGTGDCNGHGTHVAGTIGSTKYGIAPAVKLVSVRVLDCNGSGTTSGVIAGVNWVTQHHSGPSVANMSLGGPAYAALDNAVQASVNSGVTFVAAAGNSTVDACDESPARLPAVLTVAASTDSDGVASFSNYGSCVDLFAPGQGILSTVSSSDTATGYYSGTSMASPHVAGAAALYLQANPDATPAQVADALVGSATPGALSGVRSGTPNKLLYLPGSGGDGGSDGATSAPATGSSGAGSTPAKSTPTKPKSGSAYCRSIRSASTDSVTVHAKATKGGVVASKSYTTSSRGTHYGCLTGPSKANFNLDLYRYAKGRWSKVAKGDGKTSTESVGYTGAAGKYQWRVSVVKGSGRYSLKLAYPS